MIKKTYFFISFFLLATIIFSQVKNSDFENIENDFPLNWHNSSEALANSDTNIKFKGSRSISINNDTWKQSEILSDEINLKVGHIYKLSAMVKTENVETEAIKRYPTSVGGCITMESMPFTNHSQTAGATKNWHKIETYFVAPKSKDRIRLHLGYNGDAKGKIWFDDVQLTEVEDINEYIPLETVKWFDKGYRYDDRGWIFIHVEGKPYKRGYQYGYLASAEIVDMINKIAYSENSHSPNAGWRQLRYSADALMLRKFDEEYLEEMKGIADGASKAGAKIFGYPLDLLDIVSLNTEIDISYSASALRKTSNPLTGRSFLSQEEELDIPQRTHKCSGFLANKSATKDGRIVFGQIFMWGGYTGPCWNVIVDVVPSKGNRLVYQTYPGGIHSGADFYINSAGMMIGETTVSQTPFNPDGSPMANRIRKAAQYANSIEDVEKILFKNNNGMYTNDWLIGDTKTDEIAILLLGTKEKKLWRSSNNDFYGDSKDWYWSNNNNKSMKVRKECIHNSSNAPYDLVFEPWNRDIAFQEFYKKNYGKIDANAGIDLWNSSPINRPHACDGKITTSEMVENLVFFAHYGKVTLREKFVGENNRIPDYPNAIPRLTLGYSVPSPIYITEKLKEAHKKEVEKKKRTYKSFDFTECKNQFDIDKKDIWHGTVFPSSTKENWFISATSAYWRIINNAPKNTQKSLKYFKEQLASLSNRYNYIVAKEGSIVPLKAKTVYDRYNNYQVPRIKGTFLLHQLRLKLGNEKFFKIMNEFHEEYKEKEMMTDAFIKKVNEVSGKDHSSFINNWLNSNDIPNYIVVKKETNILNEDSSKYKTNFEIIQDMNIGFCTTVLLETKSKKILKEIEIKGGKNSYQFELDEELEKVSFNYTNDLLLKHNKFFTWSNFFDDFHDIVIAYGTGRQIEANHTLALRFQKALADRFTEILLPVKKESEIDNETLATKDLIILNGNEDNALAKIILEKNNIEAGKNWFKWNNKIYSDSDEGLFLALSNPFSKNKKAVYLFISNSGLELYQMTKRVVRMPQWAIFKGSKMIESGAYEALELDL